MQVTSQNISKQVLAPTESPADQNVPLKHNGVVPIYKAVRALDALKRGVTA